MATSCTRAGDTYLTGNSVNGDRFAMQFSACCTAQSDYKLVSIESPIMKLLWPSTSPMSSYSLFDETKIGQLVPADLSVTVAKCSKEARRLYCGVRTPSVIII